MGAKSWPWDWRVCRCGPWAGSLTTVQAANVYEAPAGRSCMSTGRLQAATQDRQGCQIEPYRGTWIPLQGCRSEAPTARSAVCPSYAPPRCQECGAEVAGFVPAPEFPQVWNPAGDQPPGLSVLCRSLPRCHCCQWCYLTPFLSHTCTFLQFFFFPAGMGCASHTRCLAEEVEPETWRVYREFHIGLGMGWQRTVSFYLNVIKGSFGSVRGSFPWRGPQVWLQYLIPCTVYWSAGGDSPSWLLDGDTRRVRLTPGYLEASGGAACAASLPWALAVTGECQYPESWGAVNAFPLCVAACFRPAFFERVLLLWGCVNMCGQGGGCASDKHCCPSGGWQSAGHGCQDAPRQQPPQLLQPQGGSCRSLHPQGSLHVQGVKEAMPMPKASLRVRQQDTSLLPPQLAFLIVCIREGCEWRQCELHYGESVRSRLFFPHLCWTLQLRNQGPINNWATSPLKPRPFLSSVYISGARICIISLFLESV